ncbi:MAG: hypothetical protein ABIM24_10585 [Paraperlucidibaca sp.]
MHEINCPHCKKAFKIDETGYADILKQIRDDEFDKQLDERLELAERDKQSAVELAKAKVDSSEVTQRLAVTEALRALEIERDALASELKQAAHDKQTAALLADAKLRNELQSVVTKKD